MATAADLLNLASATEAADNVPIDHLDYAYVEKCESSKELAAILALLRSGKEGRYDHLEKVVEAKMLGLLSPAERAKYEALTHVPTRDEASLAAADVGAWLEKIKADNSQPETPVPVRAVPPPRGHKVGSSVGPVALATAAATAESAPLLSAAELDALAEREKVKGNECFREGDFQRAAGYYSRSLEQRRTAVVLSNRAMARLKLKQFEFAEDDCSEAIALDASFVKAWVRRASARMALGRHTDALADLTVAAQKDSEAGAGGGSASAEIQRLLEEARMKAEAGGRKPTAALAGAAAAAPAPQLASPALQPASSTSAAAAAAHSSSGAAPANALTGAAPRRGRRIAIQEEDDESNKATIHTTTTTEFCSVPVPAAAATVPVATASSVVSDKCGLSQQQPPAPTAQPPPLPTLESALWEQHKARGNASVSAGRFKDAVASYALALDSAPQEPRPRLNRAAIRCNSALARLKELDYEGAAEDCSAALAEEIGISDAEVFSWAARGIDAAPPELANELAALVVKALFRRATALCGLEQRGAAAANLRAALVLEPHNEKLRQQLRETEAQASAASAPSKPLAAAASTSRGSPSAAVATTAAPLAPVSAPAPPAPEKVAPACVAAPRGAATAATAPAPVASPASAVDSPGGPARVLSSPVAPKASAAAAVTAAAAAASLSPSSGGSPAGAGGAALAAQRAQLWQAQPSTAMDFEKAVKGLRADPAALYAYLRAHVPGSALARLFQRRALEPDALTAVIAALHSHLVDAPEAAAAAAADGAALEHAAKLLAAVPRTRDAATVLLMASAADRQKLQDVLALLEKSAADAARGLRAVLLG